MTIEQVRRGLKDKLSEKFGEREGTAMARMIIMHLKGWTQPEMMANEGREASDYIVRRCREILGQLLRDVPIQYALGEAYFYGIKLKVGPGVLIPRPETEELIDLIVKDNPKPDLRVMDLCTGSGAIAIALARNLPFSIVEAIDISAKAVAIAKENAESLKAKITVSNEDVFQLELPSGYYDIIVSNPPYVDESEKAGMEPNVLSYEPHEALFVPDDNPLLFYRRIVEIAVKALVKGGKLYFEINPRHASEIKTLMEDAGFRNVEILKDVHGRERFAKGES